MTCFMPQIKKSACVKSLQADKSIHCALLALVVMVTVPSLVNVSPAWLLPGPEKHNHYSTVHQTNICVYFTDLKA